MFVLIVSVFGHFFIFVLLRYYCKMCFLVKVGYLRVQVKILSQIVHKSCSVFIRTQELTAVLLHVWKNATTRIYSYLIVSTRICLRISRIRSRAIRSDKAPQIVVDRSTS